MRAFCTVWDGSKILVLNLLAIVIVLHTLAQGCARVSEGLSLCTKKLPLKWHAHAQ